jgi:integrating conjugative element protein (TIGR03755 family)
VVMGEESFPFEKYKLSIKTNNWKEQFDTSGGDAIKAKKVLGALDHGNEGAEWICGTKKGGAGQPTIKTLSDIVKVGYNILFDRIDICSTATMGPTDGAGSPLWAYWNGPVSASEWALNVIGETELATCDNCTKMKSRPGKGLLYMHQNMSIKLFEDLDNLVDGTTPVTWQSLNIVSAPPGVEISNSIILSIRDTALESRGKLIKKLAGEIAYARLVEQGRLLSQMLRTGVIEPNVSNFEPAKTIANQAVTRLNDELNELDREIKTKQAIAQDTLLKIIGREEKNIQETVSPLRPKPSNVDSLGLP